MRGFMCQSVEVTSVCTITDPCSVIVPVRSGKSSVENKRLLKGSHKYSQLSELTPNKHLHPRANYQRPSTYIVSSLETEDDRKKSHASLSLRVPVKQFDPKADCMRSSSALVPISLKKEDDRKNSASSDHCDPIKQLTLDSPLSDNVFQVVVMRVSLHCQGCAGKVKKHLSKMEGVTSYSIDLEAKRVTVMGHISPDGVLESISKIKRAEFWPN